MDLHFFIRNVDSPVIRGLMIVTILVALSYFIFSAVQHRKTRTVNSKRVLIGSGLLLFAGLLIYVRLYFLSFWHQHFTTYMVLKMASLLIGFVGVFYILKYTQRKERRTKKSNSGETHVPESKNDTTGKFKK